MFRVFRVLALLATITALGIPAAAKIPSAEVEPVGSNAPSDIPPILRPAPEDLKTLAQSLVHRFFSLLSNTGLPAGEMGYARGKDREAVAAVRRVLDRSFIVQRADGSFETYENYKPVDIDAFTISDLHATQPTRDTIAVRYNVVTEDSLIPQSGNIGSSEKAPRLSIFRRQPSSGDWLLVSHANFNPPIAQICRQLKPDEQLTSNEPVASPPDLMILARRIMDRWYRDLARDGNDLAPAGGLLLPKAQLLYGDGYGRDGDSGYRPVKVSQTRTRNFVVRQDGDVLVIRFDALNQLQVAQRAFTDQWQPRLVTMVRTSQADEKSTADSAWQIAGFAIFSYPRNPPANQPCRQ